MDKLEEFKTKVLSNSDMSDLKRKCSNKKQAVSRAKSHIQSIATSLVLDVADFRRRQEKLNVHIRQYELLAARMSNLDGTEYDEDDDPVMAENHSVLKLFSDQISASTIARNGQCIRDKLELILTRSSLRGSQTRADVKAEEERARDLQEGLVVLPRMNELSNLSVKLTSCSIVLVFELMTKKVTTILQHLR